MNIEKILDSKNNLIQFFKEKGFEEENYYDDEYKDGTYFKVDKKKLLVVYEIKNQDDLKKVKDHFLIDKGLTYCVIKYKKKLVFFRNFGEAKQFIYSDHTVGKSKKSKEDKLSKINENGLDFLFDYKDVSSDFYKSFKKKRNLIVQHITDDLEPTEKYLFAQRIFDRIFFIYFLCHKGIIKFEDGRKISGENLFSRILLKEGTFLENLKKLFHLFNSADRDVLDIGEYKIVIPYLNGGLFRPDVLEQDLDISLTNKQWEDIFEFLNSYHWIIEDVKATEEYEERILTPEILGHVYERSVVEWEQKGFEKEAEESVKKISERKKKGVYYTPEPITEYITENTIIPYLLDKLNKKYDSFEKLIESKNKEDIREAIKILNKITILDPACGSGAFLLKASQKLFEYKRRLYYVLREKPDFYKLKLDIITENIYGVDILQGAIEIAKLRLWLWLISDFNAAQNNIEPLPNIEYNLKVGNSLIGWVDEKLEQVSLHNPYNDEVKGILRGLKVAFSGKEREDIEKVKEYFKSYELNKYIDAYYLLYNIYKKTHGNKANDLRIILETIRISIYSAINPAFLNYINHKIKPNHNKNNPPIKLDEFNKLNPFHWRVDFGHIIKQGGFDVVIGNPPYATNYAKHSTKIKQKVIDLFKPLYNFSQNRIINRYNLIMFFLERSVKLSIYEGIVSLIIDGSGFYTTVYKEIRIELLKIRILEIVDGLEVFSGVNTKQLIITLKNKPYSEEHMVVWKDGTNKFIYNIRQKLWKKDLQHNFFKPSKFAKIIKLMELHPKLKNNYLPISGMNVTNRPESGLLPFLSNVKYNNKYHKAIFSGNIHSYFINYPAKEQLDKSSRKKLYICFDKHLGYKMNEYLSKIGEKSRVSLGKTDDRYRQPKIFVRQSLSGKNKIEAAYSEDYDFYCDNSVYVINSKNKDKEELLYLLAILNSKLITFYAKEKNILSKASSGSAIRLPMGSNRGFGLKDFPIPKISASQQKPFIKLVNQILAITEDEDYLENPEKQAKVKELEKKIDQLVYKLYGLTEEEIKIVEGFDEKK